MAPTFLKAVEFLKPAEFFVSWESVSDLQYTMLATFRVVKIALNGVSQVEIETVVEVHSLKR